MNLKPPLTFEQQIEQLKSHHMIIDDDKVALNFLMRNNYYRFSGYALQFRKSINDSEYDGNIRFSLVVKLYEFDAELRSLLKKYLEIIEVFFRTQISYCFSTVKCIVAPYDQHYNENNYKNKKGFQEIVEHFQKERSYYRDSEILRHHQRKYGDKLPLWVITELLSFSMLSKYYNCLFPSEQDIIAKNAHTTSSFLKNHLHAMSVLRNKCAHGARLYNTVFNPPVQFSSKYLQSHSNMQNYSLFAYILVLSRMIPRIQDRKSFVMEFESLIKKYDGTIDLFLLNIPIDFKSELKQFCKI